MLISGRAVDCRTQALAGWLPPLAALLLSVHPLLIWLNSDASLADPGTGWHLAAGRHMIETGEILRADPFAYTTAGRPWVKFDWLFDCGAALLERLWGLPAATMACAVLFGLVPVMLYRRGLSLGADPGFALVFAYAAYLVGLGHVHLRPHVVTNVFAAVFLERFGRAGPEGSPPRHAWLLVPAMWIWANAHAGFVIGIALAGLHLGWSAIRWERARGAAEAVVFRRWAGLFAGLCAVTFLNPYGWHLHAHILETLGLKSLPMWEEFASPAFFRPDVSTALLEAMMLLWVVLLLCGRARFRAPEALCLLFLLHQALQSRRHIELFAIAAAPLLAAECSSWARQASDGARAVMERMSGALRPQASERAWLAVTAAAWLAVGALAPGTMRIDLLGIRLSRGAAAFIDGHVDRMSPIFNTDDLGGVLIHAFWPRLKVFVDDRNGLYGDDFILGKYFAVFQVRANWSEVLDEYGVRSVVLPRGAALGTLLDAAGGWNEAYSDEMNRVFIREE